MTGPKGKKKVNEETTSHTQRTKVNVEENLRNCTKGSEKILITKATASNKVAAIASRATYEIFFNRL